MRKKKVNPELIDEDNPEWTDQMFLTARPLREVFPELAAFSEKRKAGRPKSENPKKSKSFKLSPTLIEAIVATGRGYNARIEKVLWKALEQGQV